MRPGSYQDSSLEAIVRHVPTIQIQRGLEEPSIDSKIVKNGQEATDSGVLGSLD